MDEEVTIPILVDHPYEFWVLFWVTRVPETDRVNPWVPLNFRGQTGVYPQIQLNKGV